jgi:hypothetical protein
VAKYLLSLPPNNKYNAHIVMNFKKIIFPLATVTLIITGCDTVQKTLDTANTVNGIFTEAEKPKLTNEEVIAGLKEALIIGANNAGGTTSKIDGFLKNDLIRLPFPEDAIKVKEKALELGLTSQVEKFEATLNRAAEEAAKEAAPIFVNAIKNMTVEDGFNILRGGNNAATNFLKDKTSTQLVSAFQPKVKTAIEKVELTKYWEPLAKAYNTATFLTGGEKVNPDLENYVTAKAMDGLFLMVSKEEEKIRLDPVARVSDLLKKVFGSLDEENGSK